MKPAKIKQPIRLSRPILPDGREGELRGSGRSDFINADQRQSVHMTCRGDYSPALNDRANFSKMNCADRSRVRCDNFTA